jgi:5-methylcytosine-specific restriction endonuclease McrA
MPLQTIVAAMLLLAAPVFLEARSASRGGSHSRASKTRAGHKTEKSGLVSHNEAAGVRHATTYCASCVRDKRGRIQPNSEAKRAFQKEHPCPSTGSSFGGCPGYVIDHRVPLKRGGADTASNLRWQMTAKAKAKVRIED